MFERTIRVAALFVAAAFGLALIPSPGQTQTLWPKKHHDSNNSGYQSSASQSPGLDPELSWTYPWPPAGDEETSGGAIQQIIDDKDDSSPVNAPVDNPLFSRQAGWVRSSIATGSYGGTYFQTPAWTPDGGTRTTAAWTIPDGQPEGNYLVYVWFPGSDEETANSTHVTYRVVDDGGSDVGPSVTISQESGGSWVPLGNTSYFLKPGYQIVVSNESRAKEVVGPGIPGIDEGGASVYADKGRFVIADAVKIVQDNGSIYSSPAVYRLSSARRGADTAVVFGVVERDSSGAMNETEVNRGTVVAVDATYGPYRQLHPRAGYYPTNDMNQPLWRYPRSPDDRTSLLEGPIAGGVFSSPLVTSVAGKQTVFIGADDRQIYALDAVNGDLLWSGPGKTLDDASVGVGIGGFTPANASGSDFFGRDFRIGETGGEGRSVEYTFDGLDSYYYSVYAWVPPQPAGYRWAHDAKYQITAAAGNAGGGATDYSVYGDQSNCGDGQIGPRWIKLSGSYLPSGGEIVVTVTNEQGGQADPCANPSGRIAVAADAIRVIPDSIGEFGYCAPAIVGNRIISANSTGRIVAMDVSSHATEWIYPAVKTRQSEADQVALGGMKITVAINGEDLYYGSQSGYVGRLTNIVTGSSPTVSWTQIEKGGTVISDSQMGPITSSPLVNGQHVYFATANGYLYKVKQNPTGDGTAEVVWTYPDDWPADTSEDAPPRTAGAFRDSSPSINEVSGTTYVVIGSADSYLHAVPDNGPATAYQKIQANSGISSSPGNATKISSFPEAAFFGTNSSTVLGYSVDPSNQLQWGWSTLASMVFSSPAVADQWVYVGGDDGRLYAFAKAGIAGAGWPEGDPSISREPPGETYRPDTLNGSAFFDFEVVTHEQYHNPNQYLSDAGVLNETGTVNRHPAGDPFPGARLEWGDRIYLIAWTFDNQNATVQFNMQNVGQGQQAGTILSAAQSASQQYIKPGETTAQQVTIKDKDGNSKTGYWYYTRWAWTLDSGKLMTPGSEYTIQAQLRPQKGGASLGATIPVSATTSPFAKNRGTQPARTFTINNPLAISFPDRYDPNTFVKLSGVVGPGWKGIAGEGFGQDRLTPGAEFNGMASDVTLPVPPARHGSNTIPLKVALADRSVLGQHIRTNPQQNIIKTLRVQPRDLLWNSSVVPLNPMPWENVPQQNTINDSLDYPDISRGSVEVIKRGDADPVRTHARLIPATPSAGGLLVNPDPVSLVVEVPRYQPPHDYGPARVNVWIDSTESNTSRGVLDLADTRTTGRPLTASEVYRYFYIETRVPTDANMYAEQAIIDVGKRPMGFGIAPPGVFMPYPPPLAGLMPPANPGDPPIPSSGFFRPFVVRNDGNINLVNLRLDNSVNLGSDQVMGSVISGTNVVSSLDARFDAALSAPEILVPGAGHVLSKPRVGDLGPTTLQIPDQKQYEFYKLANPNMPAPFLPLVSVQVPIGTPSGTYAGAVPVVAAGVPPPSANNPTQNMIAVKVTAREARITGGLTAGSLANVDFPQVDGSNNPPPDWGDAQPAPYRMWTGSGGTPAAGVPSGPLGLFWASNRGDANAAGPGMPWYLYQSLVNVDQTGSFTLTPVTVSGGPAFQWWRPTDPASALPVAYGAALSTLFPGQSNVVPGSEKFSSPSIGQDPSNGATWLVFTGQVDKDVNGQILSEYRIIYAKVRPDGSVDPATAGVIPSQNFTVPKHSPRILPVGGDKLYVFWHAGLGNKYKLYYTYNSDNGNPVRWSEDTELVIPASVTAAAEPVPVPRMMPVYGSDDRTPQAHIDVVYSGISRRGGAADLFLSRYAVVHSGNRVRLNIQPLARVQDEQYAPLPLVEGEDLQRDTRSIGLYYSRHLGWVRPKNQQAPPDPAAVRPSLLPPIIRVLRWDAAQSAFTVEDVTDTRPIVDAQSGIAVYEDPDYGRIAVDLSAGTVKFERPLANLDRVVAEYTPQTLRLTSFAPAETGPFAVLDKSQRLANRTSRDPADRYWVFWREGPGSQPGNTIYYKTMRVGLKLKRAVAIDGSSGSPMLKINIGGGGAYNGSWEFDRVNNRVLFPESVENTDVWVEYTGVDGAAYREPEGHTVPPYKALTLIDEMPATALLTDSVVNEGQVAAFPDPDGLRAPGDPLFVPGRMWVFWSSSRSGNADLYYQTISPNFEVRTGW